MEKNTNIENIFEKSFKNFKQQPSEKVWKGIESSLEKPSFTKFSAKKFNVYYLAIIITVATVVVASLTLAKNENHKILPLAQNLEELINTKNISQNQINTSNNEIFAEQNENVEYSENNHVRTEISVTQNSENEQDKKIIAGVSETKVINIETPKTEKQQAVANFNISLFEGCAPLKIEFSNLSSNYENASWDLGNGQISTQNFTTYTYTKPGKYVVSLTVEGTENTDTQFDTITVFENPVSAFSTLGATNYAGEDIVFVNKSQRGENYKWIFGDGNTSESETPTYRYKNDGDYIVKLVTSNENQCRDTASVWLEVEKRKSKIMFPNAFAPNQNGGGTYYATGTMTNKVFRPITYSEIEDYNLKIYDKTGMVIFETRDIKQGWDGYYQDKLMPMGVYVYESRGTFADGEPFYLKGDLTLYDPQR